MLGDSYGQFESEIVESINDGSIWTCAHLHQRLVAALRSLYAPVLDFVDVSYSLIRSEPFAKYAQYIEVRLDQGQALQCRQAMSVTCRPCRACCYVQNLN